MNVNDLSNHLVDPARLAALHAVALLDTPTEESFDRLTWLAARFVKTPVALVSLVDANRQFFKSCFGLPEPWSSRRETPLSHSFCQHNRISGQPLLIEDARTNPLFKDNLAVRDLNVIAYLGIPLVTSDGYVLGSFCVIDYQPRQWTKEDVIVVQNLALAVMTEIQLRTEIVAKQESEEERDNLAQLNANLLSEELQTLSARQKAILAAVPDIIMEVDSKKVYTWSNSAGLEFFGDDVVGKTAASFFVDDQETSELVRPLFNDTERLVSVESRQRRKDGEIRVLSWRCKSLKDEHGRITGALSTARDITEHKRTEEAIKNANKLFATVINTAPMSIFFKDKELRYMGCNNVFARDAGVERPEDLIGKDDYQLVWKEQAELYRADDLAVIESGIAKLSYDEPMTAPGGHIKWLRTSKVPLRNEANTIVGVLGMYSDITDHKNLEDALKESRSKLEAAMASMTDAVFICDNTNNIIDFNEAFAAFHRFENKAACFRKREKYRDILQFFTPDGVGVPHEMWPVTRALRGDTVTNAEYTLHRIDIDKSWIGSYSFSPIRDKQGTIARAVVVARDITEQKQNEAERRKLETQLQQAQKMESVGRLAGGVAHDFNNMLGVILGHAEMAMGRLDPAQPLYTDLEEIRKAASRSADLTRQLLVFARKQTIAPKVLDLNEAIEGFLKMLRRLIGEDIDLAWMPGAGLWLVKVDPSQIDQILANLCVNARDSISGVGKIIIETSNGICDEEFCSIHSGCISGDYVKISVSDTGSGMDRLTLAHIFEPFFTTKEVGAGTGLGLATVYGAVKQNNGFIDVYSEPGQGTIFTIYLPRYKEVGMTWQTSKEGRVAAAVGGHETILLVEDEPAILKMTARMLQSLGYEVITAGTPGDAVRLVEEFKAEIHLLMTDVIMPEMNGRELANRLVTLKRGMKCLFMSGYTSDIVANQGVLAEGVSFIQKPFSHQEMAAKIRKVFDEGKSIS